jgi:Phosphate-selective porin O and P
MIAFNWIPKVARGPMLASLLLLPAAAQIKISSNDEQQSISFGIEGQAWADFQQDQNTTGPQGYQQNLYLRRIRLMIGGELSDKITFFFDTDQPNLGKNPKALNSGFLVQDAFFEYHPFNALRLDGGLMTIPLSRNALQSTASYYSLDISPIATVNNGATQTSALRDLGFQLRGFLMGDHLQYRLGEFSGERDSNGRDSLRSAGYIQYDFFAPETSLYYPGTTLGKKKILALNAGFDKQGSYYAAAADLTAAIPIHGGDEIGGQIQFIRYDGAHKFLSIPRQNDYLVEATYYYRPMKLQPFVKVESENFSAPVNFGKDWNRYGGGLNYYLH